MKDSLLVIDIGNSQTVFGVYDGETLAGHWRVSTDPSKTADEYAVFLKDFIGALDLRLTDIEGLCIGSVVPPMQSVVEEMAAKHMSVGPLVVGPGVKTGLIIHYDNPREVGADRIANSVAVYNTYRSACLVVDFGTAITFDPVSSKGEYLGGVIFPGLGIGEEALFRRAARLPRVELVAPPQVIGQNTVAAIQSGLIYGYADMVDGMVERISEEMGEKPRVVGTGGLLDAVVEQCRTIDEVDPWVTLKGLRIIYQMNRG